MKTTMKVTAVLLLILQALFNLPVNAQVKSDYNTLAVKAQRFYDFGDWKSALAMYELILMQRPDDTRSYASACISAGMAADSLRQISLMERAEKNAIPIDTLLSAVRSQAIYLSEPNVYIDFLNRVRRAQPWTSRMIDVRLLDFYIFRADNDMVIVTASKLLASTPDNINFLAALANAYSEKGDYTKSMDCYKKILSVDSKNIHALLSLGNYYASCSNNEEALKYLKEAYRIAPTPYLESTVRSLSIQPNEQ